jgi:hypothetical protein
VCSRNTPSARARCVARAPVMEFRRVFALFVFVFS